MAGLTHAGIGLAAKKYAPNIPLAVLLGAAYLLDFVWGILFAAGLERFPTEPPWTANPWSHGLLLSVVWSLIAGLVSAYLLKNNKRGILIGILAFSHWVIDFISHPMLATFPLDTGLPLLFDGSPLVGLGLWRFESAMYIGEYGVFVMGLAMYLSYLYARKLLSRADGEKNIIEGNQKS